MKHKLLLYSLFAAAPLLLTFGCGKKSGDYSGPINSFKRYPIKNFHLTYEYSGDVRGTEDLYVSDYGKYEARYSKFDVFTPEAIEPMNNGSITRIGDIYDFDSVVKTYSHEHVTSLDSLYHLDEHDIPTPNENMLTEMKKHLYLNTGIDTIEGKPALRWEMGGGGMTLWLWNSLLFRKHILSQKGIVDMQIKTIDSLWTVDTTKFSIPTGLTYRDKSHNAPRPN